MAATEKWYVGSWISSEDAVGCITYERIVMTKHLRLLESVSFYLVTAAFFTAQTALAVEQISIERVEKMPNMPSPYKMRDWKKVARDYDAFVFDFEKKGDHLPLIWWDPQPHDFKEKTFAKTGMTQ
jgi:hypothetical protein